MTAVASRRALVIGCHGQDGTYLTQDLLRAGWDVRGVSRRGLDAGGGRPELPFSVLDREAVFAMMAELCPDAVYYLAAHHHSSQDASALDPANTLRSLDVNVVGLVNVLDAIAGVRPSCRLLYAASSHVFGTPTQSPQTESTALAPVSAYGITKAAGIQLCRLYRREHKVFAASVILYNHESPRRLPHFLSRKVAQAVVAIAAGRQSRVVLGNLDAIVDSGWAPDYVAAMQRVMDLDRSDDFIIATGVPHSVRDLVAEAFRAVGISDWQSRVDVDPSLLVRPSNPLIGDASKLRAATGWSPSVTFEQMVRMLVDAELAAAAALTGAKST